MIGYLECPYCNESIDSEIENEWAAYRDYSMDYDTECPKCKKTIVVEVRVVPEFWYHKKDAS